MPSKLKRIGSGTVDCRGQRCISEEHTARELLIELLAHQFAFPVQWINTQETLLCSRNACKRFVELGTSSTLVGMAKKTIQRQIAAGRRVPDGTQLLACTLDAPHLRYQYEPRQVVEELDIILQDTSPTAVQQEDATACVPIVEQPAPRAAPVGIVEIEDVPIHAADVIRALIARKLKRPIAEISLSKSLKELCNGKSTLQNEMVGDFHNEFGVLPDRPEDLSLTALGEAVTVGAEFALGKTSTAMLEKLISAKMPSRFGVNAMRTYLAEQWGLKKGRQTAVLLFALTSEPESRLNSVKAVHHYLDGLSSMYAAWAELTLQVRSSEVGGRTHALEALHPAIPAELIKSNQKLARRQYEALAEYLSLDEAGHATTTESLVAELQLKLDQWTAEFSEDYLAWISPCFSAKKCRRYNTYWRSARQELLQFYDSVIHGKPAPNMIRAGPFSELLNAMKNKADSELVTIARSQGRKWRTGWETSFARPAQLQRLEESIAHGVHTEPRAYPTLDGCRPSTTVDASGDIQYVEEPPGHASGTAAYAELLTKSMLHSEATLGMPAAIRVPYQDRWPVDQELTEKMLVSFAEALKSGVSFSGKQVLVTGAGRNSIGAEVVRLLLSGGARVIVTTSREPSSTARFFQQMFERDGARGSELVLVQFNQASATDCDQLIDHIYDRQGLNRDLDAILPFAAAPEAGVEIDEVGAGSELVHRLMLTNVLRLLGRLIRNKRARGIDSNPTQVLLPLSPNHGTFGGDGLYAESKLGLESLLNRVRSESWGKELSICGVKIGWTRSTGLMNVNDMVAATVEKHGVLTFSVAEMSFNIAMLLTQSMREACEERPLVADFNGGLGQLEDCHVILTEARKAIYLAAKISKAVRAEDAYEKGGNKRKQGDVKSRRMRQRCILRIGLPQLPDYTQDVQPLLRPFSMQDPAATVVVVGFSELGPFGSARSRWEWESRESFSKAALVELAWLMGLINHVDEAGKNGQYVGWVDSTTKEAIFDDEIEQRYGAHIRKHTGTRALEAKTAGYDPEHKESLEEISVEDDLPAFETSLAVAEAFKRRHGEYVAVQRSDEADRCQVRIKRGATIMVPKAATFRWGGVAGQLPTGFDAGRYGIPRDLVRQLDPVSLYAICCVAEAFYSAGIPDPLEIFKHIHLSEIGNFIGSSMGGALKTRHLYKDVFLGREVDSDILQDTYSNTTAAWVNMLLLGSTGPIKTPVGACATGVESIDSGFESIMSGKIRMCIVGGVDDLQEDEAYGFSMLKATANAAEQLANGRLPSEMSRPTAESRAGFVEAHGCGVQILCRADLALEMGLPIYAIVAGSTMAADGVSRSVPAPGRGILSFARETVASMVTMASASIGVGEQPPSRTSMSSMPPTSSDVSSETPTTCNDSGGSDSSGYGSEYETPLTPPEHAQLGGSMSEPALEHERKQATQSPLRAALAAWGLTVDDIDMASLHGTSTKANDINEPKVLCAQMHHLGRTLGRPMWAVCQKSVTGHPKAAAASWMFNGCLQALQSGCIPGNRNADNIDAAWRRYEHLCMPTTAVSTDIRAFMLTSFGFGQKGGQVIGVAPKYLFATQSRAEYAAYTQRTLRRCQRADREYAKALMAGGIVRMLDAPPYSQRDASAIFLDPEARMGADGAISTGVTTAQHPSPRPRCDAETASRVRGWVRQNNTNMPHNDNVRSVGVDMVRVVDFTQHLNATFVERNFTAEEVETATAHVDVRAAFAGRWCAKEAVFKCLCTHTRGAGAAMKTIEIVSRKGGMPTVLLTGDALYAAKAAGLGDISLSISYEADFVIAIAVGLA